jgi:hypothetical protein
MVHDHDGPRQTINPPGPPYNTVNIVHRQASPPISMHKQWILFLTDRFIVAMINSLAGMSTDNLKVTTIRFSRRGISPSFHSLTERKKNETTTYCRPIIFS